MKIVILEWILIIPFNSELVVKICKTVHKTQATMENFRELYKFNSWFKTFY